jgi:predicted RNA-binding Zn-ribbon protein involved in translation (DUF1610 family)
MITRDIKCSSCGVEGKIQAHDTIKATPAEQIFRLLGKDSSTGFLHFQCPSCGADLTVDPFIMIGGGTVTGRGSNRRYVPIITGLLFIAGSLYLAIGVGTWWSLILGALCLMFGWPSLKTGLFASGKEIAELTGPDPVSEDTAQKFNDRL